MEAPTEESGDAFDVAAALEAAPALEEMPAASEIEATAVDAPLAFEDEVFAPEALPSDEPETTLALEPEPELQPEFEAEDEEEVAIEHAELPESEMLSLEFFLRQAAAPAASGFDEAAPEASLEATPESAPVAAFTIDEFEPEFAEEERALDTPEALAVLEMPPEPTTPELATEDFDEAPGLEAAAEDAPEIEQHAEADDSAAKREADAALAADAVLAHHLHQQAEQARAARDGVSV